MDARTLTTKTVLCYDGNRPTYWTKPGIRWAQQAQGQREHVESLPLGPERDAAMQDYYAILCRKIH